MPFYFSFYLFLDLNMWEALVAFINTGVSSRGILSTKIKEITFRVVKSINFNEHGKHFQVKPKNSRSTLPLFSKSIVFYLFFGLKFS